MQSIRNFFIKLGKHLKEILFAFIHALSLGLVQFWRDTKDERDAFWANLWKNLTQKK